MIAILIQRDYWLVSHAHLAIALPTTGCSKHTLTVLQVLDAPALADDFYLNLLDWSAQNLLAVGLESCVYLWSAHTSKVWTDRNRALSEIATPLM